MRPASRSRPPKAIRYALTTQARALCEKPRSAWIEGSATFTIVASRTIISMPAHRTYSASQRLGPGDSVVLMVCGLLVWGGRRNVLTPKTEGGSGTHRRTDEISAAGARAPCRRAARRRSNIRPELAAAGATLVVACRIQVSYS